MNLWKIQKNIFFLSAGELISRLLNSAALIYTARIILVSDFGAINLAIIIVSYFTVLLGFAHDDIATKQVSEKLSYDKDLCDSIFTFRLLLSLFLYILLITFTLICINNHQTRIYILVYGLTIISAGFYTKWFLRAEENFYPISACLILSSFVNLFSVLLFINDKKDSILIILIITLKEVINSAVLLIYFIHRLPRLGFSIDLQIVRKIVKQSTPLFLSAFIMLINFNIDQLMLGIMTDNAEVGYYSAAMKFIFLGYIPFSIIYQSFLPRMCKSGSEKQILKMLLNKYSIFLFTAALFITVTIYSFSPLIVKFIYGSNYNYSIVLIKVLIFSLLLGYINKFYGSPLTVVGKQSFLLFAVSAASVTNISANLFLIPKYHALGAAVASILSELTAFILLLIIHKKVFNEVYLRRLSITLISVTLSVLIVTLLNHYNIPVICILIIPIIYLIKISIESSRISLSAIMKELFIKDAAAYD